MLERGGHPKQQNGITVIVEVWPYNIIKWRMISQLQPEQESTFTMDIMG